MYPALFLSQFLGSPRTCKEKQTERQKESEQNTDQDRENYVKTTRDRDEEGNGKREMDEGMDVLRQGSGGNCQKRQFTRRKGQFLPLFFPHLIPLWFRTTKNQEILSSSYVSHQAF